MHPLNNNNLNNKRLNKVTLQSAHSSARIGPALLGNLVSVVCHRGDVNRGHFVSYHRAGDQWFLNDDSNHVTISGDPMEEGTLAENETVEIMFFKTI